LIAARDSGISSSSAAQDSDDDENCSTLFVVGEENILIVALYWAPKKEGFVVISRVDIYFQNEDQNSF